MRHDPEFVKVLARDMGVSPRTAKRALDNLIENGYLEQRDGGYVATLPNGEPLANETRGSVVVIPIGTLPVTGTNNNENQ